MSLDTSFIFAANTALNDVDELALVRASFPSAQPVDGCYQGETERSYRVPMAVEPWIAVLNFAIRHNQKCILAVTYGDAYLHYMTGGIHQIGTVKQVTKAQTEGLDYTYDPADQTYYIIEGK